MSELSIREGPSDVLTVFGDDWGDFDGAFEQLRRGFFPAFRPLVSWPALRSAWNAPAPTDIVDTGAAYELHLDVPGFPKEKIDVRVQGNVLQVKAELTETTEKKEVPNYLRRERSYRGFERAFELPEPVDGTQVTAKYVDGVLTVTAPKSHPVTEQKVAVA